jgi:hypothetical protein
MRGRYCYVLGVNIVASREQLLHAKAKPPALELWAGGLL